MVGRSEKAVDVLPKSGVDATGGQLSDLDRKPIQCKMRAGGGSQDGDRVPMGDHLGAQTKGDGGLKQDDGDRGK